MFEFDLRWMQPGGIDLSHVLKDIWGKTWCWTIRDHGLKLESNSESQNLPVLPVSYCDVKHCGILIVRVDSRFANFYDGDVVN